MDCLSNHDAPERADGEAVLHTSGMRVIGIGASSGGLDALKAFFCRMPADSGMAFVVLLRLRRSRGSSAVAALQQAVSLPVKQVAETVAIQPDHIYIVPSNRQIRLSSGLLELGDLDKRRRRCAPIDRIFCMLADTYGHNAAAIVLSGSGVDGALGVQRIKEVGGVVLVQDPQEAEFDALPRSAIATGAVDIIAPAAEMPNRLLAYWHSGEIVHLPSPDVPRQQTDAEAVREIFAVLHAHAGHDFSQYNRAALLQALDRRMLASLVASWSRYSDMLRSHPEEVEALLRELLVDTTSFFRDQSAWQALEANVPSLFAGKSSADQVRVWVAGCATGEEAYSVAMLLYDYASTLLQPPQIRILATDVDEQAIAIARQGLYPETIAANVSPERLQRFFSVEQDHYRIKKKIRDLLIFAPHDLLRDSPFAKLDLITCRNLLIYLNLGVQKQVLQVFHFGLRSEGLLLLGASESTDGLPSLFSPIDTDQRLYHACALPATTALYMPSLPLIGPRQLWPKSAERAVGEDGVRSFAELYAQVLQPFAPPSVIVNEHYEIVHLSHEAGGFLQFNEGEPSRNVLHMIHTEMQLELRTAFLAARQHGRRETLRLRLERQGSAQLVDVTVQPVLEPDWAHGYFLVAFAEVAAQGPVDMPPSKAESSDDGLLPTRDQLRAWIEQNRMRLEERETISENLRALNTQLRVAIEEVEASKEELQSVNEELLTINQELEHKVEELRFSNDDLQNLISSTESGTIFVDQDLRIRRYTPSVEALFNLIPADIDRPLAHVTHKLHYQQLCADAAYVLQTLAKVEREVQSEKARTYLARLLPYRTVDGQIDGVVLTFLDITERAQAEAAARESRQRLRLALDAANIGTFVWYPEEERGELDDRMVALFGMPAGSTLTLRDAFTTLIHPDDRERYGKVVAHAARHSGNGRLYEEIRVLLPSGEVRWLSIRARSFHSGLPYHSQRVYGTAVNITERKRREANLAFLADLQEDCTRYSSADEIMEGVGARLSAYLQLSSCVFAEIGTAQNQVQITYRWCSEALPAHSDIFQLSQYMRPAFWEAALSQETVVIRDAQTDPRTNAGHFAAMDVGACVAVPFHRGDAWCYVFSVSTPTARAWRDDELELIREVTNRVFPRLERARAEAALRASERRLNLALSATRLGTFLWHIEEDYSDVDAQLLRLFGLPPDVPLNFATALATLIHPDDHAMINGYMERLLQPDSDGKISAHFRIIHPDRSVRWFTITAQTEFEGQPRRPVRMYGVIEDITERKQAEEALREAAELDAYRVHLNDALRMLTQVVEIQRTSCQILREHFGASGATYWEVVDDELVATAEDTPPGIPSLLGRRCLFADHWEHHGQYQAGQIVFRPDVASDPEFTPEQKASYAALDVNAWALVPLVKEGVLQAMLTLSFRTAHTWQAGELILLRDTAERTWAPTRRLRAEQALRASEERFRSIIENGAEGVILANADREFIYVSPTVTDMLGYSVEAFRALSLAEITHPEDLPALEQVKHAIFASSGTIGQNISRMRHYDGSWRSIESSVVNQLHNPSIRAVIVNFRDITDRVAAEQSLERSRQQLRDLSARLVDAQEDERRTLAYELHDEIGQQLTGLNLALELGAHVPSMQLRELLRGVQTSVTALTSQVRQLSLELRPPMLDELGLWSTLSWHIERYRQQTGINVDFMYCGLDYLLPPPMAITAYRVVQEALTNIARHAHVATAAVQIWTTEEKIEMTIEDRGAGFDLTRVPQGSRSIGLVGMRERVELLGGQFSIESALGSGTRIHAILPRDGGTFR